MEYTKKKSLKDKLIIFDMDGTLYNFKGGSFEKSGLKKRIAENANSFVQIKLNKTKDEASKILKVLRTEYGDNISIALEEKFNLLRKDYFDYVWDVEANIFIETHKDLNNILSKLDKEFKLILISDAPQIWIDNVLGQLGIAYLFEKEIFSGDGNNRKSFGNRFNSISQYYNILPERIISVGDQENTDIIPACNLGFKTILISKQKQSSVADVRIEDVTKIEDAIKLFNIS